MTDNGRTTTEFVRNEKNKKDEYRRRKSHRGKLEVTKTGSKQTGRIEMSKRPAGQDIIQFFKLLVIL